MSAVRFDRPATPIILYRLDGDAPVAMSVWTADGEIAARSGSTLWAHVDPERLLVYCPRRHQWLIDSRGIVGVTLEGTIEKRRAATAGDGLALRLAAHRTALSEHHRRLETVRSVTGDAPLPAGV